MSKDILPQKEFHEIAGIFPLISGPEFAELIADIKLNGLRESITIYEGKILDGRNRYRACIDAEIDPVLSLFEGGDPLAFVISLNMHRRHLSSDQRAASAVEALPFYEAQAKDRQSAVGGDVRNKTLTEIIPEPKKGESRAKVAIEFKTNPRYVSDMKKIKRDDPGTFEAIKRGERKLSDVSRERKRVQRTEKIQQISESNAEMNDGLGTFPLIYADPPWRYEHSESESRSIENQYPTMSLHDICALPINNIAQDDCILFMWTTSPKLYESMKVLDAWGFIYKTCAIWDKGKIGMGYYFRQQHELLLVASKGKPMTPDQSVRSSSVVREKSGKHSEKPDKFYDLLEGMYPDIRKIELFSRKVRDGWSSWGNQSGS